ncbi:hypothetical protein [Methylobacterium tarhaniae]|uniref:hypothetical protein n=1 Tax=Methylobacterium tarhaniae TaxID=1187852 RepID=UPI0012ED6F68|nr:hypothetical protein [Methylobacterium tarhaniae]
MFALVAISWMGFVCEKSSIDAGKPLIAGEFGCVEFWINRYQSSVAALVAIFAAGLAWKGVQGQIETSKQQVDVANRQFAASALEPLQKRLETLRKLRYLISMTIDSSRVATENIEKIFEYINAKIEENADPAEALRFAMRNIHSRRQGASDAYDKFNGDIQHLIKARDEEKYETAVGEELRMIIIFLISREHMIKDKIDFINRLALEVHDMTNDHIMLFGK